MKIEQFIYTNINRRGWEVVYSTLNDVSLKSKLKKITNIFILPKSTVDIIFSKFDEKYFLYSQCRKYGYEQVGKEKRQGREGYIYVSLLIPISIINELNYDFGLVDTWLSTEVDWISIFNVLEKNETLNSVNIEYDKSRLENKLIHYLKNSYSQKNIDFLKKDFSFGSKVVSNENILNLKLYASILPKSKGEYTVFSTLEKDEKESYIEENIPSDFKIKQVKFLKKIHIENYQSIKAYIFFKNELPEEKTSSKFSNLIWSTQYTKLTLIDYQLHFNKFCNKANTNIVPKNDTKNLENKKVRILILSIGVIGILFILNPFYQYYKLTTIYNKDITFENLNNYKELISNNGFLLNSFTNIGDRYYEERERFYKGYRKLILDFKSCGESEKKITTLFVTEYKKDEKKNIDDIEKKLYNIKVCILENKIGRDKTTIKTFSDIKKLIEMIQRYRELIQYKNNNFLTDLINLHINYELAYFKPIKDAIKNSNRDELEKNIKLYEENSILYFYKKEIHKIKFLLKKNMLKVTLNISSKDAKIVDIEYIGLKNKKVNKKVKVGIKHHLNIEWSEDAYFKVEKISIFKGRLLNSSFKKIVEDNLIYKNRSFTIMIDVPFSINTSYLTEESIIQYIK